jgi:ElaB/YqjD/DUF883 family membrane-anchored ribosome-binding protein
MTDATNTTGAGADDRTSPLSGLQSAARDAARDAQQQLGQRATQAREWASSQTDVARQTVVERPFASAGAAFAAGLVFGILLARR